MITVIVVVVAVAVAVAVVSEVPGMLEVVLVDEVTVSVKNTPGKEMS